MSKAVHPEQVIKASTLWSMPSNKSEVIKHAVNHRYRDMLASVIEVYRLVLPLVGLQVRPELGMTDDDAFHLFVLN